MRLVVLESPYAGKTLVEVHANVEYAKKCIIDSMRKGEAPMAGHLLYTQVLNDAVPEERERGLNAHLAWIEPADDLVVYTDRGISPGMQQAIMVAQRFNTTIIFRTLPKDLSDV